MMGNSTFGKRLLRYILLLISIFSFFVAAVLSLSYFYPAARVFVWQQNFFTMIVIIFTSTIIWIGSALAYILTE